MSGLTGLLSTAVVTQAQRLDTAIQAVVQDTANLGRTAPNTNVAPSGDIVTDFVQLLETRQAFEASVSTLGYLTKTLGKCLDLKA